MAGGPAQLMRQVRRICGNVMEPRDGTERGQRGLLSRLHYFTSQLRALLRLSDALLSIGSSLNSHNGPLLLVGNGLCVEYQEPQPPQERVRPTTIARRPRCASSICAQLFHATPVHREQAEVSVDRPYAAPLQPVKVWIRVGLIEAVIVPMSLAAYTTPL